MWLKQYKAFLQNRVSSEDKEKESHYLTDYCNWVVPEKTEDRIKYALFDMTSDGMPELHVLTNISYTIHTMANHHQLVEWYHRERYNRPLNNGMILQNGALEKCEKLCNNILKRLKKTSRNKAAYITGIALHTIQDYYAHSYGDMTLAKYRKNGSKYIGKKEYARANAFHLDWAYEYKEKKRRNQIVIKRQ